MKKQKQGKENGFVPIGDLFAVVMLAFLIAFGISISIARMQEGENQIRVILRGVGYGIIPFGLWFIIACLREKDEDNRGCLVLAAILLILGIAGALFM